MRLVLALDPSSIVFSEPLTPGPYPWLLDVGQLQMAARAGYSLSSTAGASPVMQLSLDNSKRQTSQIIGRPLRADADVYADDGSLFFTGVVSSITYGRTIVLTVQS